MAARELYRKTSIELPPGCDPDDDIDFEVIVEAIAAARAEGAAEMRERCAQWHENKAAEWEDGPQADWHDGCARQIRNLK